jgi:hypothetical protein
MCGHSFLKGPRARCKEKNLSLHELRPLRSSFVHPGWVCGIKPASTGNESCETNFAERLGFGAPLPRRFRKGAQAAASAEPPEHREST